MVTLKCAILGASGLVSQRLQQRLLAHPNFELTAVVGSENTIGKHISKLEWRLENNRPEYDLTICSISQLPKVDVVFSALPAEIAEKHERRLVEKGINVLSNASSFRMLNGIPMVIPELEKGALTTYSGHACATNCTVVPVVLPLVGIERLLSLSDIEISTQQALSGAGWRLLYDTSLTAENLDPFIPGEEEKVIAELKYLLQRPDLSVKAVCNRVFEQDGHLVHIKAKFNRPSNLEEIKQAMLVTTLGLPSSPDEVVKIIEDVPNRKEHLFAGGTGLASAMSVVVGNIRMISPTEVSFSALSHNTIRGAAGGLILLAEYLLANGHISEC
jgi:aspartate-semialdehyde dehydrogenase